jgi:uncharacterized membrane protein
MLYWIGSALVASECMLPILPTWHWRLASVVYAASTFVGTLGFSLALLFLKFNYLEPNFRKTVLNTRAARGIPAHYYALVGHLCALPLNLCDMLYIKDRALLLHYVLSLRTNVAIGFAYGFLYVSVLR